MEGKDCLFKKFAGIDVFDIEINESDPDKLVEIVASLEPPISSRRSVTTSSDRHSRGDLFQFFSDGFSVWRRRLRPWKAAR
jgi:hypothetical protein